MKFKFIKKHKRLLILIIILLALTGILIYNLFTKNKKTNEPNKPNTEQPKDKQEINPFDTESPLNGEMTTKGKAQRKPIGIMVENHPDARPQSGLDKAEIVYEMITEGGITRFLALYAANDVSEIGPIRSARVPFVNFAREYNACYAHVGGSGDALSLIDRTKGFCDLNQFFLGKYFWRDKSRYAPHNVYTTTDKLRSAAASKKYPLSSDYESWGFKDDENNGNRGEAQNITIDFSSISYKVGYTYDKESNFYLRKQGGVIHKDKKTKEQLKAKTVIIQKVSSLRDGEYTLIKHTSTGSATIYMDGKIINGTWKKFAENQRTKFYNESNQEIAFNRGPIWIEIASLGVNVLNK